MNIYNASRAHPPAVGGIIMGQQEVYDFLCKHKGKEKKINGPSKEFTVVYSKN